VKTYYLVGANGYRIPVKGRAVHVHDKFTTFYHIKNALYMIRCQKSGLLFGSGRELKEAKQAMLDLIADYGTDNLLERIEQLIKIYGPGKGEKK